MMGFVSQIQGGTEPFLWLDPEDNEEKGVILGKGSQGEWQAVRCYGDYTEPVAYVENVKLYADGALIEHVTTDGGTIRTSGTVSPDAVITADYTYYWKVLLSGDFTAELEYKDVYKSKSFKLVTVQ